MYTDTIPEADLVSGWYLGGPGSRYEVAYWDHLRKEFLSLGWKFEDVVIKVMNHWDRPEFGAFRPIKRLGADLWKKETEESLK